MKRKIALLLAVVMVLSLVPMMSFAASGNTKTIITTVPRLADDYNSEVRLSNGTRTYTPATFLVIEQDNFAVTGNKSFQLRIENAKWSGREAYGSSVTVGHGSVTNTVYNYANLGTSFVNVDMDDRAQFNVESRTDRVLDIRLIGGISNSPTSKFVIPLYFEATGTGPVQVTVDGDNSGITSGTFTVANAAKGSTVTTIDDVITFSEEGVLDPIRIEETSAGALQSNRVQTIRLRLPNNFEWVKDGELEIEFIGGLNAELRAFGNESSVVTGTPKQQASAATGDYSGERDLEFKVFVSSSDTRGSILIKNAKVLATSSAREGDVEVRVSGGEVNAETIKVAKYSDFDVTVKADGEPTELISGRFEGWERRDAVANLNQRAFDDEAHELQTLIIKEEVAGALLPNRRTRIEFPSWVKILGVDVDETDANVTIHGINTTNYTGDDAHRNFDDPIFGSRDRGENYIELTINPENPNQSDKIEVELTFFVSVKADAEGDIVAEVSGRSGAEGKVVLGEARRPVEMKVEGKTTMLELGKKGQPIPDIIISEIEAEDLMDGTLVVNLSGDVTWNDFKVEVIEGDLELDKDNIKDDDSNLNIPILRSGISSKASTIKISGITVDVNRMVADGNINARVRGTSARRNHLGETSTSDRTTALDAGFFDQNNVVTAKVAELLAGNYREDGLLKAEIVLTIGSTTMTVDGVEETANAAPYIDAQNRTMLPVSAIGRVLGATVEWNEASRTFLITKGSDRVLLTIGSDVMNVNGMNIPMRSQAVITGSRTFVPLRDLGVALNVTTEWDAASRTVTVK